MKTLVLAAAALLMTCALTSTPSLAAKKQAAAPRSFNSCVQLAMSRGFTYSDLTEGTRAEVRSFVRRCMAGLQT